MSCFKKYGDCCSDHLHISPSNGAGRTADTFGLNLEGVGVAYEKSNGKLKCVNEQTNVENIYAIGDVLYVCWRIGSCSGGTCVLSACWAIGTAQTGILVGGWKLLIRVVGALCVGLSETAQTVLLGVGRIGSCSNGYCN